VLCPNCKEREVVRGTVTVHAPGSRKMQYAVVEDLCAPCLEVKQALVTERVNERGGKSL
jgi:hypothetical protein